MIKRPVERSDRLNETDEELRTLAEIAVRVDNISAETIHAVEVAETPDEKATAIHAAIAEAMNARAAKSSQ